jgi:hypothetical protein
MGYSKFCYALLNLKKVMIFACFNVTIYIEFELLDYLLVYLVNYYFYFFLKFLGKFKFLLLVYAKLFF